MQVRVSDFIADYLEEKIGVKSVFLLSGGGMMHLIDSLANRNKMNYYCNHHEQASAMAAEGYSRFSNNLGVCYATSGPGATNLLTGIVGAWVDSSPVLFLTGQANTHQTIQGSNINGLRQFGTFEVDIVPIVKPVTKFATVVEDPKMIKYYLEEAITIATSDRPGPVLLDVPLNIQGALINPNELIGYEPQPTKLNGPNDEELNEVLQAINRSEKPLILAGNGIRISNSVGIFRKLVEKFKIPIVTTQLGKDIIEYNNPYFIGHPGVKGDRAGNLAIQNADLIISIGSSLHAQTTGYELEKFAPNAFKIQIEVDNSLLERENVGVNLKIKSEISNFINLLLEKEKFNFGDKHELWRNQCQKWKTSYDVSQEPHEREINGPINLYDFIQVLNEELKGNEAIVTDAGSTYYALGQGIKIKGTQRYIVSGGLGAMGYALPSSIGIATSNQNSTICVTGDGSLQTNIQELQVLKHYNFDIKLFIINNNGYVSIRNTQNSFFNGNFVGSDPNSGVSLPALDKIAKAYEIPYFEVDDINTLKNVMKEILAIKGPVICGVNCQPNQKIIPTVTSKRLESGKMVSTSLDEMYPFIS
jgi:acetolactate synthase I/II/III large subunit